jgi:hypothetical protein
MATSGTDMLSALEATLLRGRELAEIPILNTGEVAYALPISKEEIEAAWRAGRSILEKTGRWPIVTAFCGSSRAKFEDRVVEDDFFSRFYFLEAPNSKEVSPEAICRRAKSADIATFIAGQTQRREEYCDMAEAIHFELEDTQERCGSAPSPADLDRSGVSTDYELEKALLEFELEHGYSPDPANSRHGWFEPKEPVLLFLPTTVGWESLAYLNWFGTSDFGSEYYIALLRSWHERFGAELVAHYGTMLQFLVSEPPIELKEAWPLAIEHDLAGGSTLPPAGIKVRDYARALINWDRWFLHERP